MFMFTLHRLAVAVPLLLAAATLSSPTQGRYLSNVASEMAPGSQEAMGLLSRYFGGPLSSPAMNSSDLTTSGASGGHPFPMVMIRTFSRHPNELPDASEKDSLDEEGRTDRGGASALTSLRSALTGPGISFSNCHVFINLLGGAQQGFYGNRPGRVGSPGSPKQPSKDSVPSVQTIDAGGLPSAADRSPINFITKPGFAEDQLVDRVGGEDFFRGAEDTLRDMLNRASMTHFDDSGSFPLNPSAEATTAPAAKATDKDNALSLLNSIFT